MRALLVLALVAIMACREPVVSGNNRHATSSTSAGNDGGSQAPGSNQGDEVAPAGVTLKLGQEAAVPGEPVTIAFLEVLEDSRCPEDVNCVWEGNSRIRLGIRIGQGERETFELNTASEPRTAARGGYVVIIKKVEPAPVSTQPIPEGAYSIQVTVGKS